MNHFVEYARAWMAERDRLESALASILGDEAAAKAVSTCAQDTGQRYAESRPGMSSSETQIHLLEDCVGRAARGESPESLIESLGAVS